MEDKYTNVGRLKKTYGSDGALRFIIFDAFEKDFENCSCFFLHLEGIYVPFFFHQNSKTENIFRLKGIDTLEKTEELVSKPMFLPTSQIISELKPTTKLKFSHLQGYLLIDQKEKQLGQITKIEAYPMQELATLDNGSIIPLSDQLILNVNEDLKILQMEIIEGLLSL